MRELVVICYSFHKCVFLLRFCTDLATYEPATLRFINNYNSTTSLYERRTNKLLVTFRNENMLYDQPQQTSNRKCLLPKSSSSQQLDTQQEQMVEPAFFDIYLCDDCDAELYSYDAFLEHEKACRISKMTPEEDDDDDDVIFCGDDSLPFPIITGNNTADSRERNMSAFLLNFNLLNRNNPLPLRTAETTTEPSSSTNVNLFEDSRGKLRRITRRTRGTITLSKCTSIPLSSPCGQFLLKSIKTIMSKDYQIERLERIERFCHAPPLVKDGAVVTNRPKWMLKNKMTANVTVSHKRGPEEQEFCHDYKFPRRQLSKNCKRRNFHFYNKLLLNRCKPCAIILERLTVQEIENRNFNIRLNQTDNSAPAALVSTLNVNEHVVIDCIDLCSSDEEEYHSEFCLRNNEHIPGRGEQEFNEVESDKLNFSRPEVCKSYNNNEPLRPFGTSMHLNTEDRITEDKTIMDTNRVTLSAVENLSKVKENRVNDWLNAAAGTPENSIMSIVPEISSSSSSAVVTNNNSRFAPKPLSAVRMKKTSRCSTGRYLEQQ